MTAHPFDAVAESYDRDFSETRLGQSLRAIVWARLELNFHSGERILELNCGTGEDALWLARHGIHVLATDASQGMLQRAREKAAASGLAEYVRFAPLDLEDPPIPTGDCFDGVLSDFGGLNCVHDLRPLARMLAASVRERGRLVLVLMNRYCLWETVWELAHFRPARAFRRVSGKETAAKVGEAIILVRYPGIRFVSEALGPAFELKSIGGLGVFLPPSYLETFVFRMRIFPALAFLERSLARLAPFSRLGDHVILEFERVCATGASGK